MEAAWDIAAQLRGGATPPPTQEVLGFRLKPLTLDHLFILEDMECALLVPDAPVELGDLLTAALVCARPAAESRKNLNAWWRDYFTGLWGFVMRKRDLGFEAMKFRRYLATYKAMPMLDPSKIGDKEMAAPISWRMLTMLWSDFPGCPNPLELTLVEINCLWAAQGDRKGQVHLASPEQLAFREAVRKAEQAREGGNPS